MQKREQGEGSAAIQIRKSKWQGNIKAKRKLNILQQDALRLGGGAAPVPGPNGSSRDEHHNYG